MKLQDNTRVVYDDFFHTYTLDAGTGKECLLPGVTEMMKLHGLSPAYTKPANKTQEEWDAILKHAADLGTAAHERLQDYAMGKVVEDCLLIKSYQALGINCVAVEYLVSDNENVASKIDMVAEVEDGVFDLIDLKRTGQLHMDALAWQLGFYKYLFLLQNPGAKVRNCYGLLIKKGDKDSIDLDTVDRPKLVKVEPEEEILKVLDYNRRGLKYLRDEKDTTGITALARLEDLVQYHSEIAVAKEALKRMQEQYDAMMEEIKAGMEELDLKELETPSGVFKIRAGSERETVDTKALKLRYPDIARDIMKVTTTKSSITFKPYGD